MEGQWKIKSAKHRVKKEERVNGGERLFGPYLYLGNIWVRYCRAGPGYMWAAQDISQAGGVCVWHWRGQGWHDNLHNALKAL